ncbi:MAG: archease [Spirochaetes bacterium]|nr:archease [Spirochaetota bacterium]
MAYELIEGISSADIAFRVRGIDYTSLFTAGAEALISIMLKDPAAVLKTLSVSFSCDAPDLDILYFDFLSEFIFYKDAENLLLLPESLEIIHSDNGYSLSCVARGETINRSRHIFTVDIKAATMHHLSVIGDESGYSATIVVDV